jgi:hypothetical protein
MESSSSTEVASTLITVINTIGTFVTVRGIVIVLVTSVVFSLLLTHFIFRKQVRQYRNLKRPVKIFYAKGQPLNMKAETKTLRESGFFNIPEEPTDDYTDCNRIGNHGLVIIGYTPGMQGLKDILDAVKQKRIPLIVYTKERLEDADKALLETYPWYSLCNVPLRVISDAYTILSIFPLPNYDK